MVTKPFVDMQIPEAEAEAIMAAGFLPGLPIRIRGRQTTTIATGEIITPVRTIRQRVFRTAPTARRNGRRTGVTILTIQEAHGVSRTLQALLSGIRLSTQDRDPVALRTATQTPAPVQGQGVEATKNPYIKNSIFG